MNVTFRICAKTWIIIALTDLLRLFVRTDDAKDLNDRDGIGVIDEPVTEQVTEEVMNRFDYLKQMIDDEMGANPTVDQDNSIILKQSKQIEYSEGTVAVEETPLLISDLHDQKLTENTNPNFQSVDIIPDELAVHRESDASVELGDRFKKSWRNEGIRDDNRQQRLEEPALGRPVEPEKNLDLLGQPVEPMINFNLPSEILGTSWPTPTTVQPLSTDSDKDEIVWETAESLEGDNPVPQGDSDKEVVEKTSLKFRVNDEYAKIDLTESEPYPWNRLAIPDKSDFDPFKEAREETKAAIMRKEVGNAPELFEEPKTNILSDEGDHGEATDVTRPFFFRGVDDPKDLMEKTKPNIPVDDPLWPAVNPRFETIPNTEPPSIDAFRMKLPPPAEESITRFQIMNPDVEAMTTRPTRAFTITTTEQRFRKLGFDRHRKPDFERPAGMFGYPLLRNPPQAPDPFAYDDPLPDQEHRYRSVSHDEDPNEDPASELMKRKPDGHKSSSESRSQEQGGYYKEKHRKHKKEMRTGRRCYTYQTWSGTKIKGTCDCPEQENHDPYCFLAMIYGNQNGSDQRQERFRGCREVPSNCLDVKAAYGRHAFCTHITQGKLVIAICFCKENRCNNKKLYRMLKKGKNMNSCGEGTIGDYVIGDVCEKKGSTRSGSHHLVLDQVTPDNVMPIKEAFDQVLQEHLMPLIGSTATPQTTKMIPTLPTKTTVAAPKAPSAKRRAIQNPKPIPKPVKQKAKPTNTKSGDKDSYYELFSDTTYSHYDHDPANYYYSEEDEDTPVNPSGVGRAAVRRGEVIEEPELAGNNIPRTYPKHDFTQPDDDEERLAGMSLKSNGMVVVGAWVIGKLWR